MEALSQLDIQNPDHISVITRDSRVTISVVKDGTSVTLGFPLVSPQPPTQQPAPQLKAVIDARIAAKRRAKRNYRNWDGPSKLNHDSVKEIRMMLKDEIMRKSCGSITNFYNVIGKKFGVTGCSISNIARGIAWKDVK